MAPNRFEVHCQKLFLLQIWKVVHEQIFLSLIRAAKRWRNITLYHDSTRVLCLVLCYSNNHIHQLANVNVNEKYMLLSLWKTNFTSYSCLFDIKRNLQISARTYHKFGQISLHELKFLPFKTLWKLYCIPSFHRSYCLTLQSSFVKMQCCQCDSSNIHL